MAVQDDLDAATKALTVSTTETVAATTAIQNATAQLAALNIPSPANTAPLLAAVAAQQQANTALAQAVTENETAVNAESAKINPTS